jgi:hypothetical protein
MEPCSCGHFHKGKEVILPLPSIDDKRNVLDANQKYNSWTWNNGIQFMDLLVETSEYKSVEEMSKAFDDANKKTFQIPSLGRKNVRTE